MDLSSSAVSPSFSVPICPFEWGSHLNLNIHIIFRYHLQTSRPFFSYHHPMILLQIYLNSSKSAAVFFGVRTTSQASFARKGLRRRFLTYQNQQWDMALATLGHNLYSLLLLSFSLFFFTIIIIFFIFSDQGPIKSQIELQSRILLF